MSEVRRWNPTPVNGGPEVVLASDYDAVRRELAEARGLLTLWRKNYQDGYWAGISPDHVDRTDAFLAAMEVPR